MNLLRRRVYRGFLWNGFFLILCINGYAHKRKENAGLTSYQDRRLVWANEDLVKAEAEEIRRSLRNASHSIYDNHKPRKSHKSLKRKDVNEAFVSSRDSSQPDREYNAITQSNPGINATSSHDNAIHSDDITGDHVENRGFGSDDISALDTNDTSTSRRIQKNEAGTQRKKSNDLGDIIEIRLQNVARNHRRIAKYNRHEGKEHVIGFAEVTVGPTIGQPISRTNSNDIIIELVHKIKLLARTTLKTTKTTFTATPATVTTTPTIVTTTQTTATAAVTATPSKVPTNVTTTPNSATKTPTIVKTTPTTTSTTSTSTTTTKASTKTTEPTTTSTLNARITTPSTNTTFTITPITSTTPTTSTTSTTTTTTHTTTPDSTTAITTSTIKTSNTSSTPTTAIKKTTTTTHTTTTHTTITTPIITSTTPTTIRPITTTPITTTSTTTMSTTRPITTTPTTTTPITTTPITTTPTTNTSTITTPTPTTPTTATPTTTTSTTTTPTITTQTTSTIISLITTTPTAVTTTFVTPATFPIADVDVVENFQRDVSNVRLAASERQQLAALHGKLEAQKAEAARLEKQMTDIGTVMLNLVDEEPESEKFHVIFWPAYLEMARGDSLMTVHSLTQNPADQVANQIRGRWPTVTGNHIDQVEMSRRIDEMIRTFQIGRTLAASAYGLTFQVLASPAGDARWTTWGKWGGCSVTCGTSGYRLRRRLCVASVGKNCFGSTKEKMPCETIVACPTVEPISAVVMIVNAPNPVPRHGVDDLWTQWADWSACSVSCGPGLRNRTRACVSRLCSGFDMQYEPCKGLREDCDNQTGVEVQGSAVVVWAMWSEWSPCDVRCGAGSRARQRSCLTPNLALCDGQTISEERQFCVKQACRSEYVESPVTVFEGGFTTLPCRHDSTHSAIKDLYWITPHGDKITSVDNNDRYRVRGFLLYVDHADVTAQGTYHCIIVRPNDVIETSDALLVVYTCQESNPCQNGGTCFEVKEGDVKTLTSHDESTPLPDDKTDKYLKFQCVCPYGYRGSLCQYHLLEGSAKYYVIGFWIVIITTLIFCAGFAWFIIEIK